MKFQDLLFCELIKYQKISKNNVSLSGFEELMFTYKSSKHLEDIEFINLLIDFFDIDEDASNNYMSIAMNENFPIDSSKHDELHYCFNLLGDLLEKCTYKNLFILFAILYYDKKKKRISGKKNFKFGEIINNLKPLCDKIFLEESLYNIPINHLRNISVHKNYKLISADEIEVEYCTGGLLVKKVIKYKDVLHILKQQNLINAAIKLFLSLIYLDNMEKINPAIKKINIRLDKSLLHLFLSLRSLGFRPLDYRFNRETKNFEIYFDDIDFNRDVKEAIIHLSQIFPKFATSLYDDEIERINPINIIVFVNNKKFIGEASLSYDIALKYGLEKIELASMAQFVNFKIYPSE